MKVLATSKGYVTKVSPPFGDDIAKQRDNDYLTLSNTQFGKKYREYAYKPAYIDIEDERIEIQLNKCANPFCASYGKQQKKFENIKSKPSRYAIKSYTTSGLVGERRIECNYLTKELGVINHSTHLVSNWSVCDEIDRLISINTVIPEEHDYKFHNAECTLKDSNPFDNPNDFYRKGTSTSNSQKIQCKSCQKNTNLKPSVDKSFNYHQKKNDILPLFMELIIGKSPVKRTCDLLKISPKTYYRKLEWIYRKCLEFLERNEIDKFKTHTFNNIWINTDTFTYSLNNVKLKGKGGKKSTGQLDKKLVTSFIASCDLKSGYVFRNDLAYDSNITMEQIELDTKKYHCDHTYGYLCKNWRLRYPFAPQPPTKLDTQSNKEYELELAGFNTRKNYIEGVHVKLQYTALAHFFLLDRMLNVKNKIYFISDDDSTLQLAINRIFVNRFLNDKAMYFTCQVDKSLTLQEAGSRYFSKRHQLSKWVKETYPNLTGMYNHAQMKILDDLKSHDFFDYKIIDGIEYPYRSKKVIKHPLPFKDEGERYINIISPIRNISDEELSRLLLNVNNKAIDTYFQSVRRKVSVLERPLVTARGDGKSYIYANYNPKYAQQLLTIYRTVYNFCTPQGSGPKEDRKTPAMKLGIANKVYDYKDIIYFR